MKKLLIFLALMGSLTIPTLAESKIMIGTFLDVQFGDYAHLQIKDLRGDEHSYFLASDPSLEKFVTDTESFKGKKVRVHWHTVTRDIPEAGGPMEIEEAFKVDVLK